MLSGVNYGSNTGYAVLHSGTVGAALTAATSVATQWRCRSGTGRHARGRSCNGLFGQCSCHLLQQDQITVLNVNVPNHDKGTVKGIRFATLAPFGAVQTQVTEAGKGHVKLTYREYEGTPEPGSDATLLADGFQR